MTGTKAGGLKAAATNKEKYGDDVYARAGHLGGLKCGVKKGFAANPELARKVGAIGGRNSRRGLGKGKSSYSALKEMGKI